MKLKTLIVTVALLAALSAVVYFINRPAPRASSDPRVGEPLVPTSVVEKARRIEIRDQGKIVTLSETSAGSWRVANYHDFPADFQKLSSFVTDLAGARIEQFVTARPERLSRLEFKDTSVTFLDDAGHSLLQLTLGRNAEAGGRFIRFGEEGKGYRANLNAWLDTEPKNWANAALLPLKAEEVAKVEIGFTDGEPVVATRAKPDEAFTAENPPAGQHLKSERITSTLSSLANLRFTETTDKNDANAAAARDHLRTLKLTTFEGKTIRVAMGRKPEQKIVKAPAPKTDGSTGPAALGSVADLAKKDENAKDAATEPAAAKLLEPETETIPAGPVFVFVSHSDAGASINDMMEKRAFQVGEWTLTGLPQTRAELFEPVPPKPAAEAAGDTATSPSGNQEQG